MTDLDDGSPTGHRPMFAPNGPISRRHTGTTDPPLDPVTNPTSSESPDNPDDVGLSEAQGLPDIPTGTYSAGSDEPSRRRGGDPIAAGAMVAGLVGLVALAASWMVRQRAGRELRKPTPRQQEAIGEPLGRILVRHADLTMLGPDVTDMIEAGYATGEYLQDGPLTRPAEVTNDVPDGDEEHDTWT